MPRTLVDREPSCVSRGCNLVVEKCISKEGENLLVWNIHYLSESTLKYLEAHSGGTFNENADNTEIA